MSTWTGLLPADVAAPWRPLPNRVVQLLADANAPARLVAHLRLVHDTAAEVVEWLHEHYPDLRFDAEAVLFGAATHDIGKAVHPQELSGPDSAHEPSGQRLLIDAGIEERLARFAGTHGSWSQPDSTLEDQLVAVADKVWKGKRVRDLEDRLVERIAVDARQERWETFLALALAQLLTGLADRSEARLTFQNDYAVI